MQPNEEQGRSFPWRSLSVCFLLLVCVSAMGILLTGEYDATFNPFQSETSSAESSNEGKGDVILDDFENDQEENMLIQTKTFNGIKRRISKPPPKPVQAPDLKVGKFSWEVRPEFKNRETPGDARKVILVKTHKTASTTLASMFLRMADMYNLRVYVPPMGSINPLMTVHPARVPPPPPEYKPTTKSQADPYASKRYDVWILHTQYRPVWLRRFVPEGLFVTSVRDPAERFVSEWFHLNGPKRSGLPTVRAWVDAVEKTLKQGKNLTVELESMRNLLAKELTPLPISQPLRLNDPILRDVLRDIRDTRYMGIGQGKSDRQRPALRAILSEYFEEGVLAMAYEWGWPLSDVVYISQNNGSLTHYPKDSSLDPRNDAELMKKLRTINNLDDIVYKVAKDAHTTKMKGLPKDWEKDLQKLRAGNRAYAAYCKNNPTLQYCRVAKSNPTGWLRFYRRFSNDNQVRRPRFTRVKNKPKNLHVKSAGKKKKSE